MIVLLIYLVGVVIAFISLVHIEREDMDITLADVVFLFIVSCFSWIIPFDLLIVKILLYLGKDGDTVLFEKKKGRT